MSGHVAPARRAERLTRWYPAPWRARYGTEFTQLLLDELADGPMTLPRRADVVAHGLWTRLTYAGLAGAVVDGPRRLRATLLALTAILAGFVLLALGVWSQLAVDWQWSAPANPGMRTAIWLMSAAVLGLGAVLMALVCGTSALLVARLRTGGARGLRRWLAVGLCAALVLALGCHHFAPHWPGSGGHAWAGRDLVPAWLARLAWAGTLWLSAYWAHPAALGSFPAGELAWMLISPVACLALVTSAVTVVRRLELSPRMHHGAVLAFGAGVVMMVLFLAGAVAWVGAQDPGPRNLFAVGAIDVAMVALLGGGLILASHLVRRAAAVSLRPAGD